MLPAANRPRFAAVARVVLAAGLLGAATLMGCANNPYPYRVAGDNDMQAARYGDATKNYGLYLAEKPGEPDVRAKLGLAYLRNKQPIEAIENLRIANIQDPEAGQYIDWLAEAYINAGRTDEAIRMLKTNTVERARVEDWVRLGNFAGKTGDSDLAKQAYVTAARIDRGMSAAPQVALHDLALRLGDQREADSRLRMAYYCDPQNSDVIIRMKAAGQKGGPGFGYIPTERLTDGER